MERFRKFMGREIKLENVKNNDHLQSCGITCTYLPDPPDEFDEFEFRTGFAGREIVITVAVEQGKIQRIMFNAADENNPEITRSLSPSQLDGLLGDRGNALVRFLEGITE
ncbi:hypothetical protein GFC01_16185 [Desulfofundulus thermobenzoicus]|uniref:Uncharacterized protein n=1 Tax=Desulfofundulus thermobenzoicus TaxID=29376 RepID=A0A6N7IX73_9FIRM|nr:hypothetical protein [Desulfofundulus thermobenzoicus]MQL53768.1 hypothetical protein [Desulfofundulus thermobenzoicus]